MVKVKTREVCRIGSSLLFTNYFVVSQVMQAGTWMSKMIFAVFHLREIAIKLWTHIIGPVVAAQQIL